MGSSPPTDPYGRVLTSRRGASNIAHRRQRVDDSPSKDQAGTWFCPQQTIHPSLGCLGYCRANVLACRSWNGDLQCAGVNYLINQSLEDAWTVFTGSQSIPIPFAGMYTCRGCLTIEVGKVEVGN